MPRSLLMDAHLARGLSYSVQNITETDAGAAIVLLDRVVTEMKAALEFADGDSAGDGGVVISGDIGDNPTINIHTGREHKTAVVGDHSAIQNAERDIGQRGELPPEKPKSASLGGRIFGSIGGIISEAIAIILIHFLFE